MILLTNDDGVKASGLLALTEAVSDLDRIVVFAPRGERSAVSHSVTLDHPLRVLEIEEDTFAVEGTPTDCVLLALHKFLKERPRLILSGINQGPNLGGDVFYSGTVAGAFEGAMAEIPSIAISLVETSDVERPYDFGFSAFFTRQIVERILKISPPPDTLLNVNIPNLKGEEIRGVRVTRLGKRVYPDVITERTDPRGKSYYWIGGNKPIWTHPDRESLGNGTDIAAIRDGCVSITPLTLDMTHHPQMEEWTKIFKDQTLNPKHETLNKS